MDDGTAANAGYGFLSQTNVGQWHIGTFGGVRRERRVIASAPPDTLIFSGFLEQATYVVPSLDLVVVRFGLPPEAQWKDHLFRSLLPGIPGADVFEGQVPPADPIDWDWSQILDIGAPVELTRGLGHGDPPPTFRSRFAGMSCDGLVFEVESFVLDRGEPSRVSPMTWCRGRHRSSG